MSAESQAQSALPFDQIALPDTSNALTRLLKAPGDHAASIRQGRDLWRSAINVLLWGLAFHAMYGFAMGLFGGLEVGLMAAVKAPLIALASLALCLPSLYVLSCVAGLPVSLKQAFALGASAVGMTGLLLAGLAPVSWLFSVSTTGVGFVVVLNFVIWAVAVLFTLRIFGKLDTRLAADELGSRDGRRWGILLWLAIYIFVSLQMATTMRPLLTVPEDGWFESGKKFFLVHFGESVVPEE